MKEKLPVIQDRQKRIGDCEADIIIEKGIKGAIMTIVDRKSRFLRMGRFEQRTKESINENFVDLLKVYTVHTITNEHSK